MKARAKPGLIGAASIALFAATLALAAAWSQDLAAALRGVEPRWAVAGLLCFGANYWVRGLRLRALLAEAPPSRRAAFSLAAGHGFFAYLLPMQAGDLSLPLLLRARGHTDWSQGAKALVYTRALDVSALGLWSVCGAMASRVHLAPGLRVVWLLVGVALAALPVAGRLVARGSGSQRPAGRIRAALRAMPLDGRLYAHSLALWALIGGTLFCAAKAVGLPLGYQDIWLLVTIQLPLQLLPVQGLANAGNHEAGWVAALTLVGYAPAQALTFALASHALLLGYVLFLGPSAFLFRTKT